MFSLFYYLATKGIIGFDTMKRLIFMVLSLLTLEAWGQTNFADPNKNILSPAAFDHISFCGISLKQIIETQGKPTLVNRLFGKKFNYEKPENPDRYWINFDDDSLSFTFYVDYPEPAILTALDVESRAVTVKVNALSFHLNDPVSRLKGVTYSMDKVARTKCILFVPRGQNNRYFRIDFNPFTKRISKISYVAVRKNDDP